MGDTSTNYYDGATLLSKLDLKGQKPEMYITQTLRSKGKTTYYNHKLLEDFFTDGTKFGIQVRYDYELEGAEKNMEASVKKLYYPALEMESEKIMHGKIRRLYADGEHCGYAFSLNGYEQIKKASAMLSDIGQYVFDEFITEDDKYVKNELSKFMSIHTSIARAPGEPVRYVPVYMLANKIRMLNPYYIALGITQRFQRRTKYLRGDGFVLETLTDPALTQRVKESGFNRAFATNKYAGYLAGDSQLFVNEMDDIGKLKGDKSYVMTIVRDGERYGVWQTKDGLYYWSKSVMDSKRVIGVTDNDRLATTCYDAQILLALKKAMRYSYNIGRMRFEDGDAKNVCLDYIT